MFLKSSSLGNILASQLQQRPLFGDWMHDSPLWKALTKLHSDRLSTNVPTYVRSLKLVLCFAIVTEAQHSSTTCRKVSFFSCRALSSHAQRCVQPSLQLGHKAIAKHQRMSFCYAVPFIPIFPLLPTPPHTFPAPNPEITCWPLAFHLQNAMNVNMTDKLGVLACEYNTFEGPALQLTG